MSKYSFLSILSSHLLKCILVHLMNRVVIVATSPVRFSVFLCAAKAMRHSSPLGYKRYKLGTNDTRGTNDTHGTMLGTLVPTTHVVP